jgi:hypothetical protein
MDAITAEFLIIYLIAIIIVDIVTWKTKIPLKFRIVYALIVTVVFLFLKQVLGVQ